MIDKNTAKGPFHDGYLFGEEIGPVIYTCTLGGQRFTLGVIPTADPSVIESSNHTALERALALIARLDGIT